MTSTSSSTPVMGTANPAQAAKQTKTQNNACKPSPTKPMPPSATWTTCPYIRRDGKVNPDVRTLPGVGTLVDMPQAAICQALAFIFTGHPSYCKQLISITSTFFLSESTRMNPSMDFGQIVRGPPPTGSQGTFTGILDFRGIIKVCNAILLIQNLPCSDWTDKWENKMWTWMKQYLDWLLTSPIGIETSKKPNNHATFYYVQVVCIQILLGDTRAAIGSLEKFFDNQFQDQLSRQGDQPFEAARTRPYHYRCFNFEALTALCKLGDQLGQNYWTRQAKTGATLKTIGDFMLNLNPRGEDMDDCLTSMAAVSAAYGDPDGLYQRWMTTASGDYQYQRFWFSMSTLALPNSPAGKKNQGSPAAKKGKRAEPEVSGLLWWWCPPEILKSGGIELTNGEFGDCEAFCRSCVDAEEKLVHKCIFGP
ncbi:alginate lyase-domain-containing protein [Mycena floridula]|nr:alginate lyase-domain-containing protein [Mycena floridula]